ncbi:MAG: hypothetical protein K9H84_06895 [Bacteroidales bacterium]|nr:hypothetical protein [Bacteroidales bacterium]
MSSFLKRIFILPLITIFTLTCPVWAQNSPNNNPVYRKDNQKDYDNEFSMIKTNPFTVLWGGIPFTSEYRLTYETSTGHKQYANLGAAYLGKNVILLKGYTSIINNPEALKFLGYKVHFDYRWLFKELGPYPEGVYLGSHISYANLRIENVQTAGLSDHAYIEHFHIAAILGYQMKFFDLFYGDLFAGVGYKNNSWGNKVKHPMQKIIYMDDLSYVYNYNIKIKIGFSFGIRI